MTGWGMQLVPASAAVVDPSIVVSYVIRPVVAGGGRAVAADNLRRESARPYELAVLRRASRVTSARPRAINV
jgi:hypothetical protein